MGGISIPAWGRRRDPQICVHCDKHCDPREQNSIRDPESGAWSCLDCTVGPEAVPAE